MRAEIWTLSPKAADGFPVGTEVLMDCSTGWYRARVLSVPMRMPCRVVPNGRRGTFYVQRVLPLEGPYAGRSGFASPLNWMKPLI
ncbi:MAG: hypothetical protein PVF57_12255 [Pseudomonadales bacterium]|jgi:hypothetical protein